jgi:hypothetical protein
VVESASFVNWNLKKITLVRIESSAPNFALNSAETGAHLLGSTDQWVRAKLFNGRLVEWQRHLSAKEAFESSILSPVSNFNKYYYAKDTSKTSSTQMEETLSFILVINVVSM